MTNSRLEKPAVLTDLIDYQDGSVVSHVLVKARAGTVTVFAFDEGEGLSEHTAPFAALLNVVEGRAGVRVGGQDHTLNAGEVILLPANVPHAVQAVNRFKMMLVMIRESPSGS